MGFRPRLFLLSPALVLAIFTYSIVGSTKEPQGDDETDFIEIEEEEYESTVRGRTILPTEDTTGFATTVQLEEESATISSVSEVVSESVGVHVRQLGGLGSYGVASIRGSTPGQVPVYLDGVLLNGGGYSTVNLGDLSLDSLETIEIYRGSTPIELETPGIGGAISLKSAQYEKPTTELTLGYGSWNTGKFTALHSTPIGKANALAVLTTNFSSGDFLYLNRNGTDHINPTDDQIIPRQNNEHVFYGTLVKVDWKTGRWKWTGANDLIAKKQGVPGQESNPTSSASLRTLRELASIRLTGPFGDHHNVEFQIRYMGIREDFTDLHDEIGLGTQWVVSHSDTMGVKSLVNLQLAEKHRLTLSAGYAFENFTFDEKVLDYASTPKRRNRLHAAVEHRWSPGHWLIIPALRFEYHHGVFNGDQIPGGNLAMDATTYDDIFWQPKLGFRYEIYPGLFARVNGGYTVRTPNLGELFGDRGLVVGNPDLQPEKSLGGDIGLTWQVEKKKHLDRLQLESAFFASRVTDMIVYVHNSQDTVRPDNISDANILGVENSIRIYVANMIHFDGNYTYLWATNQSDDYHNGNSLPGKPTHEIYGQLTLDRTLDKVRTRTWFNADYASDSYLDRANLYDTQARLFFGIGTRLEYLPKKISFTLEIKNLLDTITAQDEKGRPQPICDFQSFPLPGRTILGTIQWKI